jgi:histidyl-tRNA synthetase
MTNVAETLLCRGMRDMLPEEMRRFRRIERVFRDTCRSWGYAEVRTPVVEHLYLFTSFGTLSPQLLGRIYSFLDWDGWSGERVVLRPDATIPVARLYRESLNQHVAKLAYVENIFRFSAGDEPREVWQCGAELIGESWPLGDLELIAMACESVRSLELRDLSLCLSHSGVVRALLEHAGFSRNEQADLYDRLLDGHEEVVRDVESRLPSLGAGIRLLTEIQEGDSAFIANLRSAFLPAVPGMAGPLDELEIITRSVAASGVQVQVSVAEVRDFEYYTGPVFRLTAGPATVATGGRYDRLIADADGSATPACGFALHVDELLPLIAGAAEDTHATVQVSPAEGTPEALSAALGVAEQLQAAGMSASLVGTGEPCRWCLTVDGRAGAARYRLEDRLSGSEREAVSIDQILSAMKRA